ncbi:hypothetical protein [Paenibacillus lautus]|uniref:hypothetical protein n=1 Tax=Paenibacillus lautus TaxID=1401 RepID=UPI001C1178B2|nr:hypothetical protein [Paenibacillus lautus]MBU5344277.1 hypothetical protein [Paenibacillus lautus]
MTIIAGDFIYLEPWEAETSERFAEELYKEISKGHILFGVRVKIITRRCDRDDFLFSLLDEPETYAQVHLTWKHEELAEWPKTLMFSSFDEWVRDSMLPDNKYY